MRYSDLSGFKNMKPHTTKKNKTAKYITYTSLMNKNIFPMLYLQLNLNEMEN